MYKKHRPSYAESHNIEVQIGDINFDRMLSYLQMGDRVFGLFTSLFDA
jgi:hypothetical protein